jgi:deoxyribonuclease-4
MPDLLGAHMSIAGGLTRALERGREVGCSVVQIFLKNQRQWRARPYADSEVREFRAAWKATGVDISGLHPSGG